jgi:hypothetical protein
MVDTHIGVPRVSVLPWPGKCRAGPVAHSRCHILQLTSHVHAHSSNLGSQQTWFSSNLTRILLVAAHHHVHLLPSSHPVRRRQGLSARHGAAKGWRRRAPRQGMAQLATRRRFVCTSYSMVVLWLSLFQSRTTCAGCVATHDHRIGCVPQFC